MKTVQPNVVQNRPYNAVNNERGGNLNGQGVQEGIGQSRTLSAPRKFFNAFKNLLNRTAEKVKYIVSSPQAKKSYRIDSKIKSEAKHKDPKHVVADRLKDLKKEMLKSVSLEELTNEKLSDQKLRTLKHLGETDSSVTKPSKQDLALGYVATISDDHKRVLPSKLNEVKTVLPLILASEIKGMTETTVLRGETAAPKLISNYFKSIGGDYAESMLKPLFEELETAGGLEVVNDRVTIDESAIHVDPNSIHVNPEMLDRGKGDTLQSKKLELIQARKDELIQQKKEATHRQNAEQIKTVYSSFIKKLASSVPLMPKEMRETCATMYAMINKVHGDRRIALNSVSSGVLLRMLTPAILVPGEGPGKLPSFKDEGHELSLGSIGKLLLLQANGRTSLSGKSLGGLEATLEEYKPVMEKFLMDIISDVEVSGDLKPFLPGGNGVSDREFAQMSQNVKEHQEEESVQLTNEPLDISKEELRIMDDLATSGRGIKEGVDVIKEPEEKNAPFVIGTENIRN